MIEYILVHASMDDMGIRDTGGIADSLVTWTELSQIRLDVPTPPWIAATLFLTCSWDWVFDPSPGAKFVSKPSTCHTSYHLHAVFRHLSIHQLTDRIVTICVYCCNTAAMLWQYFRNTARLLLQVHIEGISVTPIAVVCCCNTAPVMLL